MFMNEAVCYFLIPRNEFLSIIKPVWVNFSQLYGLMFGTQTFFYLSKGVTVTKNMKLYLYIVANSDDRYCPRPHDHRCGSVGQSQRFGKLLKLQHLSIPWEIQNVLIIQFDVQYQFFSSSDELSDGIQNVRIYVE